jgi:hypothetical protein
VLTNLELNEVRDNINTVQSNMLQSVNHIEQIKADKRKIMEEIRD